ncbi:Histone deacetylase-like amidohydrolase [Thalassovita gelatinovora]|uniref:Histone deacetylase-like amidohydrolase n=1 Tax=Thalassovita gelatinovora TaxID=53501 RepID=A0A0P1F6Q4_THAGE|nr:histone deacetylase family protein [Thalassovita gelatinovora]QIZ80966.1 histone deacetylase family protein [Thalassovita gelatinovora]CUH63501.1 Histone deacetylase-like amidohydrolase [Thalassovita gelatinovora]SEQ68164.1 Acetoin utilization deacetylase AcuC [Thalassovita gelatinovora]
MTTAFYTHSDCLKHQTPTGHAEQVGRLQSVTEALQGFTALDRRDAPVAPDRLIGLCHPQSYIDRIAAAEPQQGCIALDEDTFMSPGSLQAARRAVGGTCAAIDAVMTGEVANAFVACRPPGHHAERETPMGFCLFGTVAIAAKHAIMAHGVTRVVIVDFDVHHGNGTQELLWTDDKVLFFSSHQSPLWPGTGTESERGKYDQIVNLPLAPQTGGLEMRNMYVRQVFPMIEAFKPELILISAGFDAHSADPLAQLEWEVDDYTWITEHLCDLALRHCAGRVVSTLEGGYDLTALAASTAAHVQVLMEKGA